MKTKILKVTGLLLASLVLFISCAGQVSGSSDDDEETIEKEKKPEINFITKNVDYNIQTMAAVLGDVNKIVDSDGHEEYVHPDFWSQIEELYDWFDELNEQNITSIIVDADEGDFFYNSDKVAVIEAPINKLKDGE